MIKFSDNFRFIKIIDILINVVLFLGVLFIPLFLDKHLNNFYVLATEYLFFGMVLAGVFLWTLKTILLKKINYQQTVLDVPLLALLGVNLLAAIFSVNIYDSFLGRSDYFGMSFVLVLFSLGLYYLIVNQVKQEKIWRWFLDVFLLVGGVSSLFFLLKTVLKFSFTFLPEVLNTIDGTNTIFGVWAIFNLLLSGVLIMKKNLNWGKTLFYFLLVLLNFAVVLFMGFSVLWWLTLVALLLALLLGIIFLNQVRAGWLSVLFTLLVITAIFIIFGSPKSLQISLPVEVSLSNKISWTISKDTIFSGVKPFLIGSGLGTFATDFAKFKTNDFNYDSLAWQLRFNQPGNSYSGFLSESGVLGLMALVFILLLVAGYAVQTFNKLKKDNFLNGLLYFGGQQDLVLEVFALFAGFVLLNIDLAIHFFGFFSWWLWWLVLSLLLVGLNFLNKGELVKEKHFVIEEVPQYNLVFSFSMIILLAMMVLVSVLGVRFYLAEYNYLKALQSSDLAGAESLLKTAIEQRGNLDIYHQSLAQVYLLEASQEAKVKEPDTGKVASLLALAVNEAKQATNLSPQSVVLWENLANMYENATALVPAAKDWAIKSISQAISLDPNNPALYLHFGSIYLQAGDNDKALEQYQKAIEVKKDYVAGYLALANVYEVKKDLDKAIETYSIIASAAGQDANFLFNFGRVLYNRHTKTDIAQAENLWLAAIKLQPDYSNALYSLGVLYQGQGDLAKAFEYYYKVKELNPGNNEITAKINSLVNANPQ